MTGSLEPLAARLERGETLLGVLLRLPGDDGLARAHRVGADLVVVDLVDGPGDDGALRGLLRAAGWAGMPVVAITGDAPDDTRLHAMGIDGVSSSRDGPVQFYNDVSCPLTIVSDGSQAHSGPFGASGVVALDLEAALDALLATFLSRGRRSAGDEPLVLIPGMLGDARLFESVVEMLPAGVSTRLARIDLDDSIAEMAESVLAVAPTRFALAGHSLGGIVALEIYRRAPGRVTKLALLNSSSRHASAAQLAAWAELSERTEAGEFAVLVSEQAAVNVGPSGGERLIERWTAMAARVGPEAFLRQLRAQASRPDSRPSLVAIRVPTIVISGSDDAVCPPDLQHEMTQLIPDSRHVVIDGAGHMSPLDHPQQVAEHLLAWLEARPAPRKSDP